MNARRFLFIRYFCLIVLGFFCFAPHAHAAISFSQSTSTPNGTSAGQIFTDAFGSNVFKGDTIIVTAFVDIGAIPTATDTLGDTFAKVSQVTAAGDHDNVVFIATSTTTGADSVTLNAGSGKLFYNMQIHDYSGLEIDNVTSMVDTSSTNTGTSANPSSGNLTTTHANDLVFAYISSTCGPNLTSISTLYTQREPPPGDCLASFDRILSVTTTTNATGTLASSDNWAAAAIALKAGSDVTPPSVTWTSPTNNATIINTAILTVSSTDNIAVRTLSFYEGTYGATLGSSTLIGTPSPSGTLYSISLITGSLANGSTTLWAFATDTSGNTTSASTTINIENTSAATVAISNSGSNCGVATSCTFPIATTTANHALIVGIGSHNSTQPTVSSVTDSASDTFSQAVCTGVGGNSQNCIYYTCLASTGVDSITVHYSAAGNAIVGVAEVKGLVSSNCFDQSEMDNFFSSSPFTSGLTATSSQSTEYLFGMAADPANPAETWTGTNGWVTETSGAAPGVGDAAGFFDQVVSNGPASYDLTGTGSNAAVYQPGLAGFIASTVVIVPTNVNGYAWGSKLGWVNFGTQTGGLEVMTTTVTGYAWSQNFGWINLAPASSGVLNDGHGNLSGDAWAQDAGYINFQGVTIDQYGAFHGIASGTIAGILVFDSSTYTAGTTTVCTYCNVVTTWTAPNSTPLTVSGVNLNTAVGGTNPTTITLTSNTTTNVNVNAMITDNSCSQISGGTTTILLYRSGVTSSSCLAGSGNGVSTNLNCYTATAFTTASTCSGGSENTTTTFPVQYFAQATDASSSFPNQNWIGTVLFTDSASATSSADSTHSTSSNVMATLIALNVTTSSINYGFLAPSSTTGSVNQTTTITNAGNASTTLQLSAVATLTNGSNSIATSSQAYSTSTFTYPGTSTALTASAVGVSGFLLTSPTSTTNVQSTLFWGLQVPNATPSGTYNGSSLFTAVFHS